ncbi:cell division protein FtsZ [Sphingomonas hylomeconis]|uniref:Cell division protein FtsZ n=1 Tax=Sphingomonas hylomeconis TaxID=1395958 RepID=A0ABV7SWN8_9SPHN
MTVVGVGGAGGNAVAPLVEHALDGVKVVCANTDMQALRAVPPAARLQLGRRITAGLGAGARRAVGRAAAAESLPAIRRALDGTSLCFIAAGLGGGTGSGAAPVIAQAARDMGILTVGVATKPFAFEGRRRQATAEAALIELRGAVDALVTVCNQNLFRVIGANTRLAAALALSDSIIRDSATNFALLLGAASVKNLTLADLRAMLESSGDAMIGFGECRRGADRARAAARAALDCPLLEGQGASARHLLVTIAGGDDLGLFEMEQAMAWLRDSVPAATELTWGAVIDPALRGRVRVGVVAGGVTAVAGAAAAAVGAAAVATAPQQCAADPDTVPIAAPQFDFDAPTTAGGAGAAINAPPPPPPADLPSVSLSAPRVVQALPAVEREVRAAAYGGPATIDRIRSRAARPSLVDRLYDAARDLTRRPIVHNLPDPAPPYAAGIPRHQAICPATGVRCGLDSVPTASRSRRRSVYRRHAEMVANGFYKCCLSTRYGVDCYKTVIDICP